MHYLDETMLDMLHLLTVACLFAAAWLNWRERRPIATIVGAAAASVVLFFCHLMGLVFFLVLHVARGIGWLHGRIAELLLVRL